MMIVNKKYKLNKEWLDLMLENKNNRTRILYRCIRNCKNIRQS